MLIGFASEIGKEAGVLSGTTFVRDRYASEKDETYDPPFHSPFLPQRYLFAAIWFKSVTTYAPKCSQF